MFCTRHIYFIVVIGRELIINSAGSPDVLEWSVFVGSYRWLVNLLLFYCQRFYSRTEELCIQSTTPACIWLLFYPYGVILHSFSSRKNQYHFTWIVQCPSSLWSVCLSIRLPANLHCAFVRFIYSSVSLYFLHSDRLTTAPHTTEWMTKSDPRLSWVTCMSVQLTRERWVFYFSGFGANSPAYW